MNIAQQLITIATMLVSVHTAIGVLLHDTSMDKAFTASWEVEVSDEGGQLIPQPHDAGIL